MFKKFSMVSVFILSFILLFNRNTVFAAGENHLSSAKYYLNKTLDITKDDAGGNYYNAVYYANEAYNAGNRSAELKTIMEQATAKLDSACYGLYYTAQFGNASYYYNMIINSPWVLDYVNKDASGNKSLVLSQLGSIKKSYAVFQYSVLAGEFDSLDEAKAFADKLRYARVIDKSGKSLWDNYPYKSTLVPGINEFNDAKYYFSQKLDQYKDDNTGKYYNAVYFAQRAYEAGNRSDELKTFMESATQKLDGAAFILFHIGRFGEAATYYDAILKSPWILDYVKADALSNSNLTHSIIKGITKNYALYQYDRLIAQYDKLEDAKTAAANYDFARVIDKLGASLWDNYPYKASETAGFYELDTAKYYKSLTAATVEKSAGNTFNTVYYLNKSYAAGNRSTELGNLSTAEVSLLNQYAYSLFHRGQFRNAIDCYNLIIASPYTPANIKDSATINKGMAEGCIRAVTKKYAFYQNSSFVKDYDNLQEAINRASGFENARVIDKNGLSQWDNYPLFKVYQNSTYLGEFDDIKSAKELGNKYNYTYVLDRNGNKVWTKLYKAYQDVTPLGEFNTLEEAIARANQYDYSYVMDGLDKEIWRKFYKVYKGNSYVGRYYTRDKAIDAAIFCDKSYVIDGLDNLTWKGTHRVYQNDVFVRIYSNYSYAVKWASGYSNTKVTDMNGNVLWTNIPQTTNPGGDGSSGGTVTIQIDNVQKNFKSYLDSGVLVYYDKYFINDTPYKAYVIKGSVKVNGKYFNSTSETLIPVFTSDDGTVVIDPDIIGKLSIVHSFNSSITAKRLSDTINNKRDIKDVLDGYDFVRDYCDIVGVGGALYFGNIKGIVTEYGMDTLIDFFKPSNLFASIGGYTNEKALDLYEKIYNGVYVSGKQKNYESVVNYVGDINMADRYGGASWELLSHTRFKELSDMKWFYVFGWTYKSFFDSFFSSDLIMDNGVLNPQTAEAIRQIMKEIKDSKEALDDIEDIVEKVEDGIALIEGMKPFLDYTDLLGKPSNAQINRDYIRIRAMEFITAIQ